MRSELTVEALASHPMVVYMTSQFSGAVSLLQLGELTTDKEAAAVNDICAEAIRLSLQETCAQRLLKGDERVPLFAFSEDLGRLILSKGRELAATREQLPLYAQHTDIVMSMVHIYLRFMLTLTKRAKEQADRALGRNEYADAWSLVEAVYEYSTANNIPLTEIDTAAAREIHRAMTRSQFSREEYTRYGDLVMHAVTDADQTKDCLTKTLMRASAALTGVKMTIEEVQSFVGKELDEICHSIRFARKSTIDFVRDVYDIPMA